MVSLKLTGRSNEQQNDPPYIVGYEEHPYNKSMLTLHCMLPETGFKENVQTAFFYRNGVVENMGDPCLQGKSVNGSRALYVTPECEGYFMCATEKTLQRDSYRYAILSRPLPFYGKSFITRVLIKAIEVFTKRANSYMYINVGDVVVGYGDKLHVTF